MEIYDSRLFKFYAIEKRLLSFILRRKKVKARGYKPRLKALLNK